MTVAGYFDEFFFFFSIVNVMAVFTIKLNNTLQDPFINDLVDNLNKLKDKINDKNKDINDIDENLPESEDNIIENNQIELETRRTQNNCAVYLKTAMV